MVLHGFAQDHRCLGPLGDHLAARGELLAPDAPGHGGSFRHAGADLPRGATLLAATAAQDGPSVLVGYSMGGRFCLRAALDHPEAVRALVLIGATAGIEDDGERAARRAGDHALAERMERIGLDAFLDEWLDLPLFAGLPDWAHFEDHRRENRVEGLAASLRSAGTGSMEPLWERLGTLRVPVLCLTGADDERYGELATQLVARMGGRASHRVVPGAGHAAHLEQPGLVIELIDEFLDGVA